MFARLMLKKSIEFLDRPGRPSDRWTADKEGERERDQERENKNKRSEVRQDTGWKNKVEE